MNFIFDFDLLLKSGLRCAKNQNFFCNFCLEGFIDRNSLTLHLETCVLGDSPELSFPPITERLEWQQGKKSMITNCIIALDLETEKRPSSEQFGPLMERNSGQLFPICVGFGYKFLVHPTSFPLPLPKVIVGHNCLSQAIIHLQFLAFYINALIQRHDRPIRRLTQSEEEEIQSVDTCANCQKYISAGQRYRNHCHLVRY